MIKPGEFRFTVDQTELLIEASDKVAYILEDCKDIAINKIEVQKNDFRYTEMIAGFKLSQKTFWDSANTYFSFYLQLVTGMITLIKKQYGITFDQFLEEQYLEFSSIIYERLPDFKLENPTNRIGNKRAKWNEIDFPINEMHLSKYSNTRMVWNFIGAKNDD